jgi:hypothetical protein
MTRDQKVSVEQLAARFPSPIEALEFLALLRGAKPCLRYGCRRADEQSFLDFWKDFGLSAVKADFAAIRRDNNRFVNKVQITDLADPAASYYYITFPLTGTPPNRPKDSKAATITTPLANSWDTLPAAGVFSLARRQRGRTRISRFRLWLLPMIEYIPSSTTYSGEMRGWD